MKTSTKIAPQPPKIIEAKRSLKSQQAAPSALVASYTAAAQSSTTTRSYDADIRHFKQHGGTIPATPALVADYLANFAGILAVATLQHGLIAINRAHVDINLPSPIIDHLVKQSARRRKFHTPKPSYNGR